MTPLQQKALRWCPTSDIPETPCYDFSLESSGTSQLRLTLQYSKIRGNPDRDLVLIFSDVCAFRCYWDGDGVDLGTPRPLCASPAFRGYPWPLLTIENSRWIASADFATSRYVAEAFAEEAWQHFRVLTLERHLDVLARGAVAAEWINSRRRAPSSPGNAG
jgi:hypothetical protein